jgi:membrane-associated phospholipid phosphatase
LLAAFVAVTTPPGERKEAVVWSLRRLGAGLGVRFALAQSFRRARPDQAQWLASSTGFSWPSGHTTAVTLTTGLAVEAALDAGLPVAPVLAAAIPVPLVIGWSRVYLGVHWPSDVLTGWLLGIALLPLSDYLPRHDPFIAAIKRFRSSRQQV